MSELTGDELWLMDDEDWCGSRRAIITHVEEQAAELERLRAFKVVDHDVIVEMERMRHVVEAAKAVIDNARYIDLHHDEYLATLAETVRALDAKGGEA